MKIQSLLARLEQFPENRLSIVLPNGTIVPPHFHVTEVGKIEKSFVDCGGTFRKETVSSLQVWVAGDVEHRLKTGKLATILRMAIEKLALSETEILVEYGPTTISQYSTKIVSVKDDLTSLLLEPRRTDCLAPDKCGISASCCPGGRC